MEVRNTAALRNSGCPLATAATRRDVAESAPDGPVALAVMAVVARLTGAVVVVVAKFRVHGLTAGAGEVLYGVAVRTYAALASLRVGSFLFIMGVGTRVRCQMCMDLLVLGFLKLRQM